jgi:hypothetical protein
MHPENGKPVAPRGSVGRELGPLGCRSAWLGVLDHAARGSRQSLGIVAAEGIGGDIKSTATLAVHSVGGRGWPLPPSSAQTRRDSVQ